MTKSSNFNYIYIYTLICGILGGIMEDHETEFLTAYRKLSPDKKEAIRIIVANLVTIQELTPQRKLAVTQAPKSLQVKR